ncbi:MAG TPA: hypothetical protein VGI17_13885 [Solirubrobacterales bacterium]|jgi:hypothetical protein
MGLFGRKGKPEAEPAKAPAQRGVLGPATVVSMRETGNDDGVAKEFEFVLDLDLPEQGTVRVETSQYMNRYRLHKLAPGEPARVMCDRGGPRKLLVEGHARYRTDIVANEIVVIEVEDVR